MSTTDISKCIRTSLNRYFRDLDGQQASGVYEMVLHEMEKPLLTVVMEQAGGNQTLAAEILGINRNTLRRKLTEHDLL